MEERNGYMMPVPGVLPEPVFRTMALHNPRASRPVKPVRRPDTSLARKARKARARELTRQNEERRKSK